MRYWNEVAPRYDAYYQDGYSTRENETVKRLIRRHLKESWHTLDIGCGTGLGKDLLPPHRRYTGIDPAADMIRLARAKYPRTVFHEAGAEAMPFVNCHFDGAMALFAVWSFVEPTQAVSELARVLRPGSPVLLMALNRTALWRLRRPTAKALYATRGDQASGVPARFYAAAEFSAALRPHFHGRVIALSWFGHVYQRPRLWSLDRALCVTLPRFTHNLIFVGWRNA